MQAGNDKIVTASEDNTVCVWYTKKAIAKVSQYPVSIHFYCFTGADR